MSLNTTFLQQLLWMGLGAGPTADYTTEHCFAMRSGSTLPFCNRVYGTSGTTANEVTAIMDFYGSTPFRWFVDHDDETCANTLLSAGLHYVCTFPAMHIHMKDIATTPYNTGITIKKVETDHELHQWIALVARIYNTNEAEFTTFINYLVARTTPGNISFYLGLYDDIPVATSMFIRHNTTIDMHWVGTLPDYRKKGIGYAVSHTPLVDAYEHGATKAILFASELGKPIYTRIGFKDYAVYDVYGLKKN